AVGTPAAGQWPTRRPQDSPSAGLAVRRTPQDSAGPAHKKCRGVVERGGTRPGKPAADALYIEAAPRINPEVNAHPCRGAAGRVLQTAGLFRMAGAPPPQTYRPHACG